MPADTQHSAAFWDRVARRYAGMSLRNPAAYETTLARIRPHLKSSDTVLELGCGTGSTALLLAPSVGRYVGSDYSSEMIAIAREKLGDAGQDNLDFCVAQTGDGSLPTGPFEVALAFNVLHLLPDRRAAFDEIRQRLHAGGLFISKTPCPGGRYRVLQPVVAALRLFGKAPSFNFLTPAKLQAEIRHAGFEIVDHGDFPARPPSRFIIARKT